MAKQEIKTASDDSSFFDMNSISSLMSMMLGLMFLSALTPLMNSVSQQSATQAASVQAQSFSGVLDPRELNAIGDMQWLNLVQEGKAWITADIVNKGSYRAFVAINNPGPWQELDPGDSLSANMSGAYRRIESLFYKCDPGNIVLLRVVGKY